MNEIEDKKNVNNSSDFSAPESSLDLKEIFYILSVNAKLVSAIILISILSGILYIATSPPLYQASGTILVENKSSGISLFSNFSPGSGGANLIDNEVEILKSKQTLRTTINRLIADNSHQNMFLFRTRNHQYEGLSKLLRELLFLDYFNDYQPVNINDAGAVNGLINSLKWSISVVKKRKSDVIKLSMVSPDPNEASLIINYLITSYQNLDKEWANGEMIHMKSFLDSQISIKEDELKEIENELSDFQKKEQIYALTGNSELLLNQLSLVESDYYSNQVKNNILKERERFIEGKLTEEEKSLTKKVMNTINERLFALKSEIAQRESDLISTIALQGEDHQAVLSGKVSLKKLKNKLEEETKLLIEQGISVADPIEYRQTLMDTLLNISAQKAFCISKSNELDKIIKKYEEELKLLPDKSLQLSRLERDRRILSETYALMMQKREEAKIGEASKLGKIRIVDLANPEPSPVAPRKAIIMILSLILGVAISGTICFIKEYLDNTIKSIVEIERAGIDIIGMIPTIGKEYRQKNNNAKLTKGDNLINDEKLERRLITHEDSKSPISEAYRSLRTNLIYRFSKESLDEGEALLVSSPGPGEGKTTTISNLAITFANLGKKTLLVDTDLRKPVMHTVFNKSQSPGLTDYLLGKEDKIENLVSKMDGVNNLSLMTSGYVPPFPSELLGSKKMNTLIAQLKANWDIVLFDLPPLMAVTDAYVILRQMDQFIFVLRAGVTQKGAFKRSISYLSKANISQIGAVLNQVDKTKASKDEHFDYYADYYGIEE